MTIWTLGELALFCIKSSQNSAGFSADFAQKDKKKAKKRAKLTTFMQNKPDSPSGQMVVRPITRKYYSNMCCLAFVKNKPNTDPIQGKRKPNKANLPEKQEMDASSLI